MKPAPIVLAFLLLAATPALPTGPVAQAGICNGSKSCPLCTGFTGTRVRWADHHSTADARCAIDTENGKVTLLLTDRVVALQLSDRTLHKVRRELRHKDKQDNWLGDAIAAAVKGTVSNLIDSSFECRIRDLRDVTYENGRLTFISRTGRHLFDDTDLDDTDLATAFSPEDARRFVEEFHRVKVELLASR